MRPTQSATAPRARDCHRRPPLGLAPAGSVRAISFNARRPGHRCLGTVLCPLIFALLLASTAQAAGLDLVVPVTAPGRTFQVGITVRDAADLYGAALDLTYDPAVITLIDRDDDPQNGIQPAVSEGPFLGEGGTTPTVFATALEDDRQGRLLLGVVRRGPALGASTAEPRLLATARFRARARGTTSLSIERATLSDSGDGRLPLTTSSATLLVATAAIDAPPSARAGPDRQERPGRIPLDATASTDPQGDPLTYRWSLAGGPAASLQNTTSPVAILEAPTAGSRVVRLEVSDASSTSTDEVTIDVTEALNRRPAVAVRTPGPGQSGAVFIGFVTADPEGDTVSVTIERSTDGIAFSPARAAGGDGLTNLAAPPSGASHVFVWNSLADLGAVATTAFIRIRATDTGGAGVAGSSGSFQVDNRTQEVLVSIRSPKTGDRFFEGQQVPLSGLAADSAGAAITGAGLVWTSSIGGQVATGSETTAILTTGEHVLTLTARDSQGRTATRTVGVQVAPRPAPANLLTISGRITLAASGLPAPDGTRLTFFNLSRRVSAGAIAGAGDGSYSALVSRSDNPAAAPGDLIRVDVGDVSGALLTASPASFTLAEADFLERSRLQDISVVARSTLPLERGLNLVALPADPAAGAGPIDAAALAGATGAQFVIRTVPGGAGQAGRFEVFIPGGPVPAFSITGDQAYLLQMSAPFVYSYVGRPWPDSARSRRLHAGVNLIAFPRGAPAGFDLADLGLVAATRVVARFDRAPEDTSEAPRRFRLFSPAFADDPEPVENGKGYIVVVPAARDLTVPAP